MECHVCGTDAIVYAVPDQFQSYLPEVGSAAATCPRCLSLQVTDAQPADAPSFQRISDAFPSAPEAAVPMAIALGLLSSLALNRQAITDLFEATERAGADPMLIIGRLIDDPDVDPQVDLSGRRRQLDQLR